METTEVTVEQMADVVAEQMKLNDLLSDYVGRVVPIVTKDGEWTSANGIVHRFTMHAFASDRDLVNEMIAIIEQHGLQPRITFPETIITCDFRIDRYNVHLKPISNTGAIIDIVGLG